MMKSRILLGIMLISVVIGVLGGGGKNKIIFGKEFNRGVWLHILGFDNPQWSTLPF